MGSINPPQINCHTLQSGDQHLPVLSQLIDLNKTVFQPATPEEEQEPNYQRKGWEERLSLPNAKIFYATNQSSLTPDQPIGFFFMLPRTQPEIGYELLHIWLAAVDPAARGLRVFPLLMEGALDHARRSGGKEVTVCTFPARFKKMYRILNEHGWELVAWPMEGVKVLMKMTL